MWEPNLGRLWAHPMPLKKKKKRKKPKNLPKSSKNVGNFITFFLKCSNVFGNFPKCSIDHVAWDFFNIKNDEFSPQKRKRKFTCGQIYLCLIRLSTFIF